MKELEIGQTIYVNRKQIFGDNEPNLKPYKVVRFNGTSFYASPENTTFEQRFDRKTFEGKMAVGDRYIAYLTKDEYWDMIERKKERRELKVELKKLVDSLDVEQLRKLKVYLNKQ